MKFYLYEEILVYLRHPVALDHSTVKKGILAVEITMKKDDNLWF